jgi:hypothetical protein
MGPKIQISTSADGFHNILPPFEEKKKFLLAYSEKPYSNPLLELIPDFPEPALNP